MGGSQETRCRRASMCFAMACSGKPCLALGIGLMAQGGGGGAKSRLQSQACFSTRCQPPDGEAGGNCTTFGRPVHWSTQCLGPVAMARQNEDWLPRNYGRLRLAWPNACSGERTAQQCQLCAIRRDTGSSRRNGKFSIRQRRPRSFRVLNLYNETTRLVDAARWMVSCVCFAVWAPAWRKTVEMDESDWLHRPPTLGQGSASLQGFINARLGVSSPDSCVPMPQMLTAKAEQHPRPKSWQMPLRCKITWELSQTP